MLLKFGVTQSRFHKHHCHVFSIISQCTKKKETIKFLLSLNLKYASALAG